MGKVIIIFSIIVSLFLYGICLAEEVALSDDFKNLGSIGVKVTISHSEESFLAKQLTKQKIYHLVKDRLNLARIEILEGDSFHNQLGEPYLSVVVSTMPIEPENTYDTFSRRNKNRLHMYDIKVSLFETAILIRNKKRTLVGAWNRNYMGWSRTTDGIEKVIKEMVEIFCKEYISANIK